MKSRRNKDKLIQLMEKRGENDALTIGTVGGKLHLKPNLASKISALHIEFHGEVVEITISSYSISISCSIGMFKVLQMSSNVSK